MTKQIQKREPLNDSWTDLDRTLGEMRTRFFDAFGIQPFGVATVPVDSRALGFFRAARTDVTDTGKSYKIVAEVPGIPKERLDIRIRGTSVEIRGEQAEEKEKTEAEYVHRERTYAGYYRSLELSEPVIAAKATAKVENGLLELELPKERPRSQEEVRVNVR